MKPKYFFNYNFPNKKIEEKYIDDAIHKLKSEYYLYQKYGKYRVLKNWDEYEDEFIRRLNYIQKKEPDFKKISHLVIYDDIFVDTLSIDDKGCIEPELIDYVRTHLDNIDYIENMDVEKLRVVKFDYKYECKISIETNYTEIK